MQKGNTCITFQRTDKDSKVLLLLGCIIVLKLLHFLVIPLSIQYFMALQYGCLRDGLLFTPFFANKQNMCLLLHLNKGKMCEY